MSRPVPSASPAHSRSSSVGQRSGARWQAAAPCGRPPRAASSQQRQRERAREQPLRPRLLRRASSKDDAHPAKSQPSLQRGRRLRTCSSACRAQREDRANSSGRHDVWRPRCYSPDQGSFPAAARCAARLRSLPRSLLLPPPWPRECRTPRPPPVRSRSCPRHPRAGLYLRQRQRLWDRAGLSLS
jgi:hypothetical protein